MVKAPARDPSDFCIAHCAEPALFVPEKTKGTSTPERFLHLGSFALFEVGFIGRVVGVRVTFTLTFRLMGVRLACHSQIVLGCAWSSHVSPKKDKFRPPRGAKYFCLRQRVFLFGCRRRAHRHRLEKIS